MTLFFRYADTGDAVAGHSPHVRQCSSPLLLCLLHLWHRWCAAVGWTPAQPLFPRTTSKCHPPCRVSNLCLLQLPTNITLAAELVTTNK